MSRASSGYDISTQRCISLPGAVVSKAMGWSMNMAVSSAMKAVTGWPARTCTLTSEPGTENSAAVAFASVLRTGIFSS